MDVVIQVLKSGLLAWLGLLALMIAIRVAQGKIQAGGILVNSSARLGQVDPERAVAMVIFPYVILMYALDALHADMSGAAGRPSMPDVPTYLLTLMTGGHGVYLAGKFTRTA